ncbi:MAG: carboxypeptidase regulatory-like domain-containing protein [Planctomyces sp.]|nr:carboxypeptidase regulatory-like domain-containing protein [Planctomyces sp.]
MLRRTFFSLFTGLLLAGMVGLTGCGGSDRPPLGQVTGTVTLDGQPLVGVNIIFSPDDGRAAAATTDAEGKYELQYLADAKGCKVGPNTMYLEWPPEAEDAVPIPAGYTSATGQKVEVKEGSNVIDFPIKSE